MLREIESINYLIEKHKALAELLNHSDFGLITNNSEFIIGKGGNGCVGLPLSTLVQNINLLCAWPYGDNNDNNKNLKYISCNKWGELEQERSSQTPFLNIPSQSKLFVSMPTTFSGLVTNFDYSRGENKDEGRNDDIIQNPSSGIYIWSDATTPILSSLSNTDTKIKRSKVSIRSDYPIDAPEIKILTHNNNTTTHINNNEFVIDNLETLPDEGLNFIMNINSPATLFINSAIKKRSSSGGDLSKTNREKYISDNILYEIEEKMMLSNNYSVEEKNRTNKLIQELKREIKETESCLLHWLGWKNNLDPSFSYALSPSSAAINSIYQPMDNISTTLFLYPWTNTQLDKNFSSPLNTIPLVFRDYDNIISRDAGRVMRKLSNIFNETTNTNIKFNPSLFEMEDHLLIDRLLGDQSDREKSHIYRAKNNNNFEIDILEAHALFED